MRVLTAHVSQACNDKREVQPTIKAIQTQPEALGQAQTRIADNGYCSQTNVQACSDAGIAPLLAIRRESHHLPVMARFAPDAPPPQTSDPLARMVHELGTQAGRALYKLRKQTVEPVFGIINRAMGWRQMSMRGLDKAQGEWTLVTMAWNISSACLCCGRREGGQSAHWWRETPASTSCLRWA